MDKNKHIRGMGKMSEKINEVTIALTLACIGFIGGLVRTLKDWASRENSDFKSSLIKIVIAMFVGYMVGEICIYYELSERLMIIAVSAAGYASPEIIEIIAKCIINKIKFISQTIGRRNDE